MTENTNSVRHEGPGSRSATPVDPEQVIGWNRADRFLLGGLVAVAALVLLPNLGDRCLWQDEARTALAARGILRTGLPVAWDGRLLATGMHGAELTDTLLWAQHPWAAPYLAAAGMAVFGQTSLGARLPFALLGCASVGLTYVVARRLVRDRWASCLAAVLLITSVQYLLFVRQCRYDAILPVASLLAVWGYTDLFRRRGMVVMTAGMLLLFHANYVACACVGSGLAAHALLWRRERGTLIRLAFAAGATAVLTLPWFLGMGAHRVLRMGETIGMAPEPTGQGVFKLLFVMNQFVCPLVIVVGLAVGRARSRLRVGGAYGLVACMAAPVMILVPLFLTADPRYLIHMLPLGAIVVAAALRELYLRNDVVGNVGAIVAGVTNLLPAAACALFPAGVGTKQLDGEYATGTGAIRQAMLKSEWAGYVHELRAHFIGPNEAITRFLNQNSEPDDIIYTPYGQLPIMFHTNRRCAGLLKPPSRDRPGWDRLPDYLWDPDAANWLIFRPAWMSLGAYDAIRRRWRERAIRTGRRLAVHTLPVRDIGWGNRPLLLYHYAQSPGRSQGFNITLVTLRDVEGLGAPRRSAPRPGRRTTGGRRR